jgi:hypothetical protein
MARYILPAGDVASWECALVIRVSKFERVFLRNVDSSARSIFVEDASGPALASSELCRTKRIRQHKGSHLRT